MHSHLLDSLTPPQREAVEHREGALLILAGPGSGKTRVITHRIARLLHHGIPARQILALTFTNKAADEMRQRVERLAPGEPVWMSTFHRFCSRLLRQHAALVGLSENFTIYDTSDSRQLLRRVLDEAGVDPAHYTPDRIAHALSWAKNNLISAAEYTPRSGHPLGHIIQRVYPLYAERLLRANAVDFDDLLLHVAVLLRGSPETRSTLDARYRYILVDEYQDTNLAQYSIVRALSIDYPNLAVTGDPDQSIYGWRGANLKNILDFEQDFAEVRVVKLERNYRSTKAILRAADALIGHNRRRKQKSLYTENAEGAPVSLIAYVNGQDEADLIAERMADDIRAGKRRPRDFAIFYRVNALSRSLEFALRQHGIPYQMVNGLEFYQRKEIKDVLAYLRLINNPRDDNALLRIINTPARSIGKSTIDRLLAHAHDKRLPLLDAARESGLIESLAKRAAVAVARFVAMIDRLMLVAGTPVEEILGHVLTESGYRALLEQSEDEEDQERLANLEELLTAARQFDEQHAGQNGLEGFLEEASLVADVDAWDADTDRVTLMTLHASKGLEFPVVFIIALEEGLIPHERSRADDEAVEEERRLLFVGMTRAKDELQLSLGQYREFRGQRRMTIPSPFLLELPRDELRMIGFGPQTAADYRARMMADQLDAIDEAVEPEHLDADALEFDLHDIHADVVHAPDALSAPDAALSQQPTLTLATAAELHEAAPQAIAPVSPDDFAQGMVVRHPEYGLGKIIALSGAGPRRLATVAFASSAGQKKFVLSQSQLRPANTR
ncbi:MAG TPA: UvrD-helicase domain-containing protein [Pirellulales bacterium]|nr:UvrD-helicase domain-containing protein [Pirellulales bacterium]